MENSRRTFIKTSAAGVVTLLAGGKLSSFGAMDYRSIMGANERLNIAVVGFHNRGMGLIRACTHLENVKITALCDIDQRLFANAVAEIEKRGGEKPELYTDYRKLLENKDIHAVVIATPDHWHALQAIWACKAGKDVYIEKPLAFTVGEGRKIVEAARKYNRVVQAGTQSRSNIVVHKALQLIREGIIGDIYMARAIVFGFRSNIGRVPDSPVPEGVDWDMFLGPAPWHPFNENRFHYKWHWFWDTSTTEFGNNATHWVDLIRMAMDIKVHPQKIQCMGGFYVWDSDQEIPNIQLGAFQYPDNRIVQIDVRSIYNNHEGGDLEGAFLYGSKGWMHLKHQNFRVFFGQKSEPGPSFSIKSLQAPENKEVVQEFKGLDIPHLQNFVDCVRTRKWQDLNADVLEGHLSSSVGLLGNIAYRVGRTLEFDGMNEKFIADPEADSYLVREYRLPYRFPETV